MAPLSNENSCPSRAAGTESVRITFCPSEGPLFPTVMVYWNCWPGTAGEVPPSFTTLRSADCSTSTGAVSVLLSGFGSGVVLDTTAVLDRGPAWAEGDTVPRIRTVLLSPGSRVRSG